MRALKLVAEALGFKDPDEMYVHIGTGKEKAQHVTNRLLKILVDKGNEEAEKPTVAHRPPPRASWPPCSRP